MDFAKLHEEVVVVLCSDRLLRIHDARESMVALGFKRHDDVWSLDRTGLVPTWQHGSIVELDFLNDGTEVYANESWDAIQCRYLFASLPLNCIPFFVDVVFALSDKLLLSVSLGGRTARREDLLKHFEQCAGDLQSEFGEVPGSESLAILIQSTYPR